MTRLSFSATLIAALSVTTTIFAAEGGGSSSEICPTMFADFQRRQVKEMNVAEVFELEDGAKHTPFLTLSDDGKTGTVVVGNGDDENGVWHPMVASVIPDEVHFITHIMVKDQDGNYVALESMDPTAAAPATMTFSLPAGAVELTPYTWCNKHGFWMGEPVTVTVSTTSDSPASCGVSEFQKGAWTSVHSDFMRLQKAFHDSDVPFDENLGVKHTPYINLKGDGTASVLVGQTDVVTHPMNGSPDGIEEPHWITEIYVMDQSGSIVTMSSLDVAGADTATLDFEVPENVESLQAYVWCNLHGLWEGPIVTINQADGVGAVPEVESSGVATGVSAGAVVGAALLAVL